MGVYIKGMKMPKDCEECREKTNRIGRWCRYYRTSGRAEGCPLVEVAEPHGRLIDAEVVKDKWVWLWPSIEHFLPQEKAVTLSRIDDAPTVIESEE